ncbi:hypothetical protein WME76_00830 [Sorangium sp. So ce119]|uniref:hypothetical protein n=1 Tax=Sorangium sp. So ce119 TaxID=3133279 RepID=UPI003F62E955
MPPEPTLWFALAAEDTGHHAAVTRLTDRVLEARIGWFMPETRDEIRRWRAPTPMDRYWELKRAFVDARRLGLPIRGNFGEQPEVGMIRAQLLLWKRAQLHGERIDVGFIARDTDGKRRLAGARQAVNSGDWGFRIVLAYPDPEIEAWYIAGFEPATRAEQERAEAQQKRLKFSPMEQPERLKATVAGTDADTKNVLAGLTADDPDRKSDCLETSIEQLRKRGERCGLAAFLEAVETEIVPLLGTEA